MDFIMMANLSSSIDAENTVCSLEHTAEHIMAIITPKGVIAQIRFIMFQNHASINKTGCCPSTQRK